LTIQPENIRFFRSSDDDFVDLQGLSVLGSGVEIFHDLEEQYFAARLPAKESTQLYILMPDKTNLFTQFVKRVDTIFLEMIESRFQKSSKAILIPKISKKSVTFLKSNLQPSLLKAISVSNSTDFSGINAKNNLYLSDLLQISQFEISDHSDDKKTSIFWRENIDNDQIFAIKFNRPFVYILKSIYMDIFLHIGYFSGF
jgi:serine protease inhibitor